MVVVRRKKAQKIMYYTVQLSTVVSTAQEELVDIMRNKVIWSMSDYEKLD